MTSRRTAVVTIVGSNYLARASVLRASVRRWHPEWEFVTVVVDGEGEQVPLDVAFQACKRRRGEDVDGERDRVPEGSQALKEAGDLGAAAHEAGVVIGVRAWTMKQGVRIRPASNEFSTRQGTGITTDDGWGVNPTATQ